MYMVVKVPQYVAFSIHFWCFGLNCTQNHTPNNSNIACTISMKIYQMAIYERMEPISWSLPTVAKSSCYS